MAIEQEVLPFLQWLLPGDGRLGALASFVLIVVFVGGVLLAAGYLVNTVRHGPIEAFFVVVKAVFEGVGELRRVSPRRLWAMTRLTIQESLRRKVLIVFVLFLLGLLMAGWFLDVETENPARLYISFVLTATSYLVLAMALLLSTFSIPNDIKSRTIYTVVTKPVMGWEVIMGRILGFSAIGTALLLVMCATSYVFVVRGMAHRHTIDPADMEPVRIAGPGGEGQLRGELGVTSRDAYHRHVVSVDADGYGRTDVAKGHWHELTAVGEGPARRYLVGPPRDALQARVPVYGTLRFLDRSGAPAAEGVNVGNEWTYRSYIEGGTLATAIWTFENVSPRRFPEGLPLEMTLSVFRTHKGDIERGIFGTIVLRNPDPDRRVQSIPIAFTAREHVVDQRFIPRQLKAQRPDGSIYDIDLFEHLVHNGRLEVWVRCGEPGQYYGMAEADLYLRAADGWFWFNFTKGYVSIWCQMVLVVAFSVMFSTFLSGPVAMLATLSSVVIGYFAQFIAQLASGELPGGGPMEMAYRLFTQMNLVEDVEVPGAAAMKTLDAGMLLVLRGVTILLPDYSNYSAVEYVANGFNVSTNLVGQHVLVAAAYVLVVSMLSYFFFRAREIAA